MREVGGDGDDGREDGVEYRLVSQRLGMGKAVMYALGWVNVNVMAMGLLPVLGVYSPHRYE